MTDEKAKKLSDNNLYEENAITKREIANLLKLKQEFPFRISVSFYLQFQESRKHTGEW